MNEERFFSYVNDKMNHEDRQRFESELKSSPGLAREFVAYQRIAGMIRESANISLSDSYTGEVLLRFRNRPASGYKRMQFPAVRYALAVFFAFIGYLLFSQVIMVKDAEKYNLYSELTYEGAEFLSDDSNLGLAGDFDYLSLSEMILVYEESPDIIINQESEDVNFDGDNFIGELNISELDYYLSESEFEALLAGLSEKSIYQRSK